MALRSAIRVGVNVKDFNEMTPYELNLVIKDYQEKQKNDFEEKLSLEYYNAMWTIQWLGKKSQQPKPLDEILNNLYKEPKKKEEMSAEQMLNQVIALNNLFGGEIKYDN